MANDYIVNALWSAATEAVNHKDIKALKDIAEKIYGEVSEQLATPTPKTINRTPPSKDIMSYRAVIQFIDSNNLLEKYISENDMETPCTIQVRGFKFWLFGKAEYQSHIETPKFSDQINSAFLYAASGDFAGSESHPMVKKITKGDSRGHYIFQPIEPKKVVNIASYPDVNSTKAKQVGNIDEQILLVLNFIESNDVWDEFIRCKGLYVDCFTEGHFRDWVAKNYEDEIQYLEKQVIAWGNRLITIFADYYANPSSQYYKGIESLGLAIHGGHSKYRLIEGNKAKYNRQFA